MFFLSLLYTTGLIVLAIIQLSKLSFHSSSCEKTLGNMHIWDNGCKLKIPFCKTLFTPKCNCAYLHITNDSNLTFLPENIVTEMTGLRQVYIYNCNLTTLPKEMEKLTEMYDFDVSMNYLQTFDVDVKKWDKLLSLYLGDNNIINYNKEAIWKHPNIMGLDLRNNIGIEQPPADSKMIFLQFLDLDNNDGVININFNHNAFPNLRDLYLNGNKLASFPDKSLKDSLQSLGIARCNLRIVPTYLSKFHKLKYLDLRDNNITYIDENLKKLIHENDVESYFANNPICNVEKSIDCKPLCSKFCWSRKVSKNGDCDPTCNSKECDFDGGDCDF